jgi:tRNA pseudouridine38-40 synthase
MSRIKLLLEYDGSNYHGFQLQKNANTIQAELEKAIYRLSGEQVAIVCAGRTDAGVHAWGQVVAFNSYSTIPGERWAYALNSQLPEDIQVLESQETSAEFNPRFDALKKCYCYLIYRQKEKATFYRHYAFCSTEPLKLEAMQEAAGILKGRQNFRCFCASGSSARTFEREIFRCCLSEKGPYLLLHIEADGFLYNMVRIITGTLLEVGRGKYPPQYLREIIASQDRTRAGPTAPPQGLYLLQVFYPEDSK